MTASQAKLATKPLPASIYTNFRSIIDLPEVQLLSKLFLGAGHEMRVAGGAVRDLLTGVIPHDVDFATTATPVQMIDLMSPYKEKIRIITTKAGEKHGTVTARVNDKSQYEITTLRIDKITDGRHAEVEFTLDWKLDASRRDLTINAMFLDLEGTLYDFFGGADDLEHHRIRFVGNAVDRIQEDYLRIFRYFRFYSRYGHRSGHDGETLKAMRDNISGLTGISGERIWTEMKRILPLEKSNLVFPVMLNEIGISKYIGMTRHPRDFVEFERTHANLFADPVVAAQQPVTLFTSLIESEEELKSICSRLKLSNVERDTALYILVNRSNPLISMDDLKRQLALSPNSERKLLKLFIIEFLRYCGRHSEVEQIVDWTVPTFPLRGDVIGRRLAKKRDIKVVYSELQKLWVDSDFKLSDEQLKCEIDDVIDKFDLAKSDKV
ncbi:CCA tRNA nucleotidyltransferase 1, mitochondrial [Halotydeus destructor]|nr:CCA tRNA nucleotidyltransferase 1, mitochondrial [Halotydeus destructor]